MDQSDRDVNTVFTQPIRQILIMVICLCLVGFVSYVAYPRVESVFLANPYLNGLILFVFIIGVAACFWQVISLVYSVSWIEGFAGQTPGHEMVKAPSLLAPLASLLRSRGAQMQIGAASSRSILDSVATRIDEARDITRYITNLLIFLGLLGTFFGLATTVPAVVETIRSLAPQEGDSGVEIFTRLMNGLETQLGGMGVAFASSLLGLAGSLVVGLLELFASHGQNRFYRELEDWLSTITRLGFSTGDSDDSGNPDTSAIAVMLDHFSEQLATLQGVFANAGAEFRRADNDMGEVATSIQSLVEEMTEERNRETSSVDALNRLAEGQEKLIALLSAKDSGDEAGVDAESRMRLRSIDVQLLRILEEMSAGRQESIGELRSDVALLTKSVRELAERGRF